MALTDKLTAIANAIRAKTSETTTMTLADMPTKISGIKTWYEGTTEPSSSLGSDGDLYVQTTGG